MYIYIYTNGYNNIVFGYLLQGSGSPKNTFTQTCRHTDMHILHVRVTFDEIHTTYSCVAFCKV